MNFEDWFKEQGFYFKFLYMHGDRLFLKDGDEYRNFYVNCIYKAFCKDKPKESLNRDWVEEIESSKD